MTGVLVELVAALKWRLVEMQDGERQAAEKRLGVPAGDEAVLDDPRYSLVTVLIGDAQESLDSVLVLGRDSRPPAAPAWVVGGPDRSGAYNGPTFEVENGPVIYTAWTPERGGFMWLESVTADSHMGVREALDFLRLTAEAASVVAVTR